MEYIEPLDFQTIFVKLLAGDASYFAPIAIFLILVVSGYLRMNILSICFIVFVFLVMFSGFIPPTFLIFISLIGGLAIGFILSKIVKN